MIQKLMLSILTSMILSCTQMSSGALKLAEITENDETRELNFSA
jgi:hypothetical protein